MPDEILEVVRAGVEVAKKAPANPRHNVEARDLPTANTPAEIEANKLRFENTNHDISEALAPGERYLTPEEAKERREEIMRLRKERGMNIYE